MPHALLLALVCFALPLGMLAGCGSAAGSGSPAAGAAAPGSVGPGSDAAADTLAALRRQIDLEVGDAAAASAGACRAMPLGDKPCGGPAGYVVYSAEASDEGRLQDLTARYTALQRARNRALGLSSDCAVTPEPAPVLEGGRCVAEAP